MSVLTELYANPATSTTVSSGGTTAPSAGTSESWTMAGGYAGFPSASNTATPNTQFHVIDPALPTEIMAVTNVSGTTWTVTRGAESTTPVAHASGFTVQQVVTAGALKQFLQAPPSLDGLVLPSGQAQTSVLSSVNATSVLTAASLSIAAGEANAGSCYEIEAWGVYGTASSSTVLTWAVALGSTTLGSNAFTMPASIGIAAPARWRFKGSIAVLSSTLVGSDLRLEYVSSNSAGTAASVFLFGDNGNGGKTVTSTATNTQTLSLTLQWTTQSASNGVYVLGSRIWKSA